MDKKGLVEIIKLKDKHYDDIKTLMNKFNTSSEEICLSVFNRMEKDNKFSNLNGIKYYLNSNGIIEETKLDAQIKTDDMVYYRIKFSYKSNEYILDFFYRDLDCGTRNIHIVPGIITLYVKTDNSCSEYNTIAGNDTGIYQVSELGYDIVSGPIKEEIFKELNLNKNIIKLKGLLDQLAENLETISNKNKGIVSAESRLSLGKNNYKIYNWIYELDATKANIKDIPTKSNGTLLFKMKDQKYTISKKEMLSKCMYESIIKYMTLCYSICFYNPNDLATAFAFYTAWQKYYAHAGVESLEINYKQECVYPINSKEGI